MHEGLELGDRTQFLGFTDRGTGIRGKEQPDIGQALGRRRQIFASELQVPDQRRNALKVFQGRRHHGQRTRQLIALFNQRNLRGPDAFRLAAENAPGDNQTNRP